MIESASNHKQNTDTFDYFRISNIRISRTALTLERALLEAEEEIWRLGGAQALPPISKSSKPTLGPLYNFIPF